MSKYFTNVYLSSTKPFLIPYNKQSICKEVINLDKVTIHHNFGQSSTRSNNKVTINSIPPSQQGSTGPAEVAGATDGVGQTVGPVGTTGPAGVITPPGFSAFTSGTGIAGDRPTFSNWVILFAGDDGFNASNGVYTIPETGRYAIAATIIYSAATMTSILQGDIPKITIQNSTANRELLIGTFPALDVNINPLTLRTILSNGTIMITGNFALNAGDQISMQYEAGGLSSAVNLGSGNSHGITWSIHQIQ